MKIFIPKDKLTIKDVVKIASRSTEIAILSKGRKNILRANQNLNCILAKGKMVYGVNTGFGALKEKLIPSKKWCQLQTNLIKSHALGTGDYFEKKVVRAAMFLRANMLSKGYSGVRLELVKLLIEMINRNVVPLVYKKGSVGASGDLAPLAFIALVLIGKGKAFYENRLINAKLALKKAGLEPVLLKPKEGLALINGTEMMSAVSTFNIVNACHLIELADIASALSFVALDGNAQAFDIRVAKLKPYPGQLTTTKNLLKLLKYYRSNTKTIQDAYSLRCVPQINGAVRESIHFAQKIVETEINSVTDNPLIFGDEIIAAGNFHGQTIALAMDNLAIAICVLGSLAERRIARLLDPALSGLEPFLTPKPGLNSGLMMAQLLAASLNAENKVLATPASIHSTPTSANQEDFVSMGMDCALKAEKVISNTKTILALELICACQGIELANRKLNKRLSNYFDFIRALVPFQKNDAELTKTLHTLLKNLEKITG